MNGAVVENINTHKVLLVEDNLYEVELVEELLCQKSVNEFSIIQVDSAHAALQQLSSEQFDSVLLDLNLPDSTGLDTLNLILSCKSVPPVVVITYLAEDHMADLALKMGAQDFLIKGEMTSDSLSKALHYGMERHSLQEQLSQLSDYLNSSANEFNTIVNTVADGILIVGLDGRIQFANQAAHKLFSGQDLSKGQYFGLPIVSGEMTELEIVFSNDENRTVEMRVKEIQWERNAALLAAFWDISDRVWVEQDLMIAKKAAEAAALAKSEFLSITSHELRTPMNAIIGMANILELSGLSSEHRECVMEIQRAARGLLALIDDILELSNADEKEFASRREPFSLINLITSVTEFHRLALLEKGLSLKVDYPTDLPNIVDGDEKHLRQVLIRLLGNSIKFSTQGSVSFLITEEGRSSQYLTLRFDVIDSGIGIPGEAIGHVFEPFFQVDSTTTRKFKGSGLGLAIVKRFVTRMGGNITVESKPGVGSRFSVILTFSLKKISAVKVSMPEASKEIFRIQDTRVLVVDDDDVNRLVLFSMLRKMGIHAEIAKNGKEALYLLTKNPYDVIFLDCLMPVMDGFTACRVFRLWEEKNKSPGRCHRVPVIATTALTSDEDRRKCFASGMDDYLSKPVTSGNIQKVLFRWLKTEEPVVEKKGRKSSINREVLLELRKEIDEAFPEVMATFLEKLPEKIESIKEASSQQQVAMMIMEANALKVTCDHMGLTALSGLLSEMVRLGLSEQLGLVQKFLPRLEGEVRKTTERLMVETI